MPSKAVYQALQMLYVPAFSLASQLLQFSRRPQIGSSTQSPVGAGLPAKAVYQALQMLYVPAFSLSSQLLQVFVS